VALAAVDGVSADDAPVDDAPVASTAWDPTAVGAVVVVVVLVLVEVAVSAVVSADGSTVAAADVAVTRGHGKMMRRPTATAICGSGSMNASEKSLSPLRAKPSTMRHCRPAALGPVTSGRSTAASSSLTA